MASEPSRTTGPDHPPQSADDHGHGHDHGHGVGHEHRSLHGGQARAAVFGASDGLVSNLSLVLGVAGGGVDPSVVRLGGIAGLVAGAFSMAVGEYVSVQANNELIGNELEKERRELARNPEAEHAELAALYSERGMDPDRAAEVAAEMMRDPEVALATHAREELGVSPDALGSPLGAAAASFGAFAVGAVLPVIPWYITEGTAAVVASAVVGVLGAVLIGALVARFSARPYLRPVLRQVFVLGLAGAATYLVGRLLGVTLA